MTVYDRLLMELSNQMYLTEAQYIQLLTENGLTSTSSYDKSTMQKALLYTVIDVLDAVMNDVDSMRSVSTEFADIGAAYQFLEQREQNVKDKIAAIPDPQEESSPFSLLYTRGGTKTMGSYITGIDASTISNLK